MENFTKRKRIYLTPKSYLKKVRSTCLAILIFGAVAGVSIVYALGITFLSLGIAVSLGLFAVLMMRYVWRNSCSVSLKDDNLLIKNTRDRNIVAPIGSVREVKSVGFFGFKFTSIRYHLDGLRTNFFIVTKTRAENPETLIRKCLSDSRKRKKEANHKPDPVLTHTA